jgi:hypothetical protein
MEITEYKAINKNSLLGKFNLKINKWGNFIIREVTLFSKDNRRWISFPAKAYEKDNEKKYFSYMIFEQREVFDQFQEKVLHALDNYFALHPEAQVATRNNEVMNDNQPPPF